MNMKAAKTISFIGILAMTAVLIYGFTSGNFSADGADLLKNPWGVVSMVDLYTGFILFSAWIAFREKNLGRSLLWIVLMMVLGFFTASVYAFIALTASKGDWTKFWMGERADE